MRIQSLDLARGFTVLCMPSIHVAMLYSSPDVQRSLLAEILGFIAEGPGAQLFMLLLGVNFNFSRHVTSVAIIKKSLAFFIVAYQLNGLKFIIPFYAGWLPDEFFYDAGIDAADAPVFSLLRIGDILHFAAIALLIVYAVQQLKQYQYWALLLAAIVLFVSPLLWDLKTGNRFIDFILALFNGHPPQTFFPAFPWLVYPLVGLSLGYFLKRSSTKVIYYAGATGFILMIISVFFPSVVHGSVWPSFYRTRPCETLYHLGVVLSWVALFQWLTSKVDSNLLFDLLTYCSQRITSIYLIQWILIFWCLPLAGYAKLGLVPSLYWMTTITLSTLLLTYFFHVKHK